MTTGIEAPGIYRGIVSNDADPEGFGRIQAIVPQLFGNSTTTTDWAWPVYPVGGYGVPSANTPVWIAFIGADIDYPVWLGTWTPRESPSAFDPAGAAVAAASAAQAAAEAYTLSKLPWGTSTAWTSYVPTWTAASSNPSVGNGSLNGHYQLVGPKTCSVRMQLNTGSTTTYGSGVYTFALPFTAVATGSQAGIGILNNGNLYPLVWVANFGAATSSFFGPTSNSLTNLVQLQSGTYFSGGGQFLLANMVYETT